MKTVIIDRRLIVCQFQFSDESLKLFRLKILDKRRKYHLSTEQEVSKRWQYEEQVYMRIKISKEKSRHKCVFQIKRPYFHVKPLERAQLKNWRSYLDFEISVGQRQRITVLFERCLIACALYEDIWIKVIGSLLQSLSASVVLFHHDEIVLNSFLLVINVALVTVHHTHNWVKSLFNPG